MDIPALSTAMSEWKTATSVGIAVMKMANEMMEVQGEQIMEIMDDMSRILDIKI